MNALEARMNVHNTHWEKTRVSLKKRGHALLHNKAQRSKDDDLSGHNILDAQGGGH